MSTEEDKDTKVAAAAKSDEPEDEEEPTAPPQLPPLTTAQVCERLSQTFHNVERALRCPISQSCFRSATMLSVCCHTFSGSSLKMLQPIKACPVCNQKCSKRSLVAVPQLDRLVRAYKVCGTAFGLMPATHDPTLIMTQLPASQEQSAESSLADAHEQLLAARTFAKYCHAQGYREERQAVVLNMERTMVRAAVQKTQQQHKAPQMAIPTGNSSTMSKTAPTTIATTTTAVARATQNPPPQDDLDEEDEFSTAPQSLPPPMMMDHTNNNPEEEEDTKPSPVQDERNDNTTSLVASTTDRGSHHGNKQESPSTAAHKEEEASSSDASHDLQDHEPIAKEPEEEETKESPDDTVTLQNGSTKSSSGGSDDDDPFQTSSGFVMDTSSAMDTGEDNVALPTTFEAVDVPMETKIPEGGRIQENSNSSADGLDHTASARNDKHGFTPAADAADITITTTTTAVTHASVFAVGDVVQVQSRTWPGVNLPGGVGRIKTVYQEKENVRYDIDYVLGGRERKVDAVFCTPTDLPHLGRRQSTAQRQPVASQRLERKQKDEYLPPDLLAQLKSEGFDVGGGRKGANVSTGKRSVAQGGSSACSSRRPAVQKKCASEPRSTSVATNRKRKAPPRDETTTTTASRKKTRTGRSILARVTNLGKKQNMTTVAPLAAPRSNATACAVADKAYKTRYDKTLSKSTISLVTSGLSDTELERVQQLCRTVKDVRIRVSSTISKQTTMCIMAADPKTPTLAKIRTAKSMRAALLGIPLVTPTWIDQCLSSGKLVPPSSFLRALPTKSSKCNSPGCGVAQLAASSQGLLQNYHLYLCLPSRLQQDVTQLIKDAGGAVTSRLSPPRQDQPLVIICGDSDHGVSNLVQKMVKNHPQNFQLVHSHWLFDSVSHGGLLSVSSYKPPGPKARALCTLQE